MFFRFRNHFGGVLILGNQDFPLDITVVKKWIAPDVGIIKFTQSQTRGELTVDTVFELDSFKLVEN